MNLIDPVSLRLHRGIAQHGPVILVYHGIAPGKRIPASQWSVSMQQFCRQIDFLAAQGYATATVADLIEAPAAKWIGRTAVITFDDGYADNLSAFEALQRRGMHATWFIVSGSMGQPPKWPTNGRSEGRILNAPELREMQRNGMEIGSHSVNHVRLAEVDDACLMHELTDSKAMLEDALSTAVKSFAYPYGVWDERCDGAVSQAGYTAACTTCSGWALRDKNPYKLRRLTIFNVDTVSTVARKLSFASNDVSWSEVARYALRRIARI